MSEESQETPLSSEEDDEQKEEKSSPFALAGSIILSVPSNRSLHNEQQD